MEPPDCVFHGQDRIPTMDGLQIYKGTSHTGWWFGCHEFYVPILIGNVIIPIDVHIFQRGGPTTNQHRNGWFGGTPIVTKRVMASWKSLGSTAIVTAIGTRPRYATEMWNGMKWLWPQNKNVNRESGDWLVDLDGFPWHYPILGAVVCHWTCSEKECQLWMIGFPDFSQSQW